MTPRDKKIKGLKTSVILNEEVLIRAKQEAIARRMTFSDMIEALLRRELGMPEEQKLSKSAAEVAEELRQGMERRG